MDNTQEQRLWAGAVQRQQDEEVTGSRPTAIAAFSPAGGSHQDASTAGNANQSGGEGTHSVLQSPKRQGPTGVIPSDLGMSTAVVEQSAYIDLALLQLDRIPFEHDAMNLAVQGVQYSDTTSGSAPYSQQPVIDYAVEQTVEATNDFGSGFWGCAIHTPFLAHTCQCPQAHESSPDPSHSALDDFLLYPDPAVGSPSSQQQDLNISTPAVPAAPMSCSSSTPSWAVFSTPSPANDTASCIDQGPSDEERQQQPEDFDATRPNGVVGSLCESPTNESVFSHSSFHDQGHEMAPPLAAGSASFEHQSFLWT